VENEELSQEIFSVLKGANYNLLLYKNDGSKTADPVEATRFYASDADLMVSIRFNDTKAEVLVQAGQDFDVLANKKLISIIKNIAHKNLGEFTVKKFDKSITPKDFAHQSVTESAAFGKAFGGVKTSYMPMQNAKLIIKHSKGVNEEVRGSRSRNIHSLFIENSQGERFSFPYKYMAGAKAMAMHVNEGGTPYDNKGASILSLCEEIADLNKFVRHVRSNKLVNENNTEIVETVRSHMARLKETINSLTTLKGYNNFQSQEVSEEEDKSVDISEKFLYNTITTEDLEKVMNRVNKIVGEAAFKDSMEKETITALYDMIKDKQDFGISFDANDPDHPDHQDPKKFGGQHGSSAKLASMLTFLGANAKSDEAANHLLRLSDLVPEMTPKTQNLVAQMVNYLNKTANTTDVQPTESISLDEGVMLTLRKMVG
jgi:uncharacterized protein YfkK (UPF0435 family)